MRVLIGELFHETNSFCPNLTTYEEWMRTGFREGDAIRGLYEHKPHAIGGMLQALEDAKEEWDIVYGVDMRCHCISGGIVEQSVMDKFVEKMTMYIRENAPLDGILLSMHGAMQTTEYDDPEAEIVRRLRLETGEHTIISISTDLHAYISDLMLEHADFICGYHTYPHVDYFETGYRAASLMLEKIKGESLKTLKIRIPMIVPASVYSTLDGPFKELMEHGQTFKDKKQIRDYSIYQMQPWLDIQTGGSCILVVGNDETEMKTCAIDLAERLLAMRFLLMPNQLSIDEVIDKAIKNTSAAPVILVDSADSPNAGASGDSMAAAKKILDRKLGIRSAIAVNDSRAVEQAFSTGIGSWNNFRIGGELDNHAVSIEAKGYVRSLHDGEFLQEGPAGRGMVTNIGRTAVIRFGKMDVVVCEKMASPGDPQLYRAFGIEPTLYRLVVVKACTSFRAAYNQFTHLIYETDTPGSAAVNLKRLDFKKLSHDFWPWNDLKEYQIQEWCWGR